MFGWYTRSRHVSVQDGAGSRGRLGDLHCVRAMVAGVWAILGIDSSLGNGRVAQNELETMCLHVYKGDCMQKYVYIVCVWEWLERTVD